MDWSAVSAALRDQARKDNASASNAEMISRDFNSALLYRIVALFGNRLAHAIDVGLEEPVIEEEPKPRGRSSPSKASVDAVNGSWARNKKESPMGRKGKFDGQARGT